MFAKKILKIFNLIILFAYIYLNKYIFKNKGKVSIIIYEKGEL